MTIVSPGTRLAYKDLFQLPEDAASEVRLPTRTPETQPDGDAPDRPVIVALDSDGGLDAFAPETQSVALPEWPPEQADDASLAHTAPGEQGSAWTDEDFVVRFPGGEPVADDHVLPRTAPRPPSDPEQAPFAPSRPRPDRTRHVLLGLGVLVLLQAIPTALWLQGRVSSSAAAATEESVPATAADPAPVDLAAATTGRSGRDDVVLATPPRAPAAVRREERRGAKPAPASASAPSTPPVIAAGLLSVDAPVPMQIVGREGVVGTTEAATIMLPPGTYELEFRNDAIGYRERQTVTLQPGRTTRVRLAPQSGRLHVNALPWAEVWIDNARAGQTPIGNLEVPVGTHEVVFRHPELGERRATVLVTLKEAARVSVDLRQP